MLRQVDTVVAVAFHLACSTSWSVVPLGYLTPIAWALEIDLHFGLIIQSYKFSASIPYLEVWAWSQVCRKQNDDDDVESVRIQLQQLHDLILRQQRELQTNLQGQRRQTRPIFGNRAPF